MRKQHIHDKGDFFGPSNPVGAYLKDIRDCNKLSTAEEKSLGARIRRGDRKAVNELVNANLKFVVAVCRNYEKQGMPLADLINEGNLGLMRAASRFDDTRECRFISYAVWWVRQSILNALADQSRTVRLTTSTTATIARIGNATRKLTQILGREPSVEELELETGLHVARIRACKRIMGSTLSLNYGQEGKGSEFLEALAVDADFGEGPDSGRFQTRRAMEQVMKGLDFREREILRLYFGIGSGAAWSLRDLARRMGLSIERVRQIKKKAMAKLKSLWLLMEKYPCQPAVHVPGQGRS